MLAALVGALLVGGCERSTADAPPPDLPEVAFITAQPERIVLTSELPGRTAAWLVAEVRPQVGGLIRERLFEEGADVEKGQTLYQIDDALFQSELVHAEANLQAAQNGALEMRATVEASLAAVEQQRAVLELAETNRERYAKLAREGAGALSERDRYATEAKVAEATLRSALAQVNRGRQAVEVAQAGIAQAQAAVETARINLNYTRIDAPISGRIGKSNVTVGSLVMAHQPQVLTTIQQLNPIYVDVPQSSGDLLRLRQRIEESALESDPSLVNKVRLVLENGQLYPHEGTLEFRDVTVDPSNGSVSIRMVFPNPEGVLLPGMFVRAVIVDGVNPEGILVPQQAIARNTKAEPYALVLDEANQVSQRTVTLDRAVGNRWLILEGLQPGDRVIVEGMQRVRDGSKAKPVPFSPAQPGPVPAAGVEDQPTTNPM